VEWRERERGLEMKSGNLLKFDRNKFAGKDAE